MTQLAWETLATPVGPMSAACSPAGVARVRFGPPPPMSAPPAPPPDAAGLAAEASRQLAEYFAGQRREFRLPVDWSAVSATRRRVLSVLAEQVGFGQTVTYGDLAQSAGVPAGGELPPARVVGQIMGANPYPVIVPCHRVVAGTGLGGYSGGTGTEIKRWLLIFEQAIPATLDWDPAGPAYQPGQRVSGR